METFKITKIKGTDSQIVDDFIASEVPFTIMLGDKELATLLCSPCDLEDLARGFLFTSGLIQGREDIKSIVIDSQRWSIFIELVNPHNMEELIFKRLYTSGCGRGTLIYNPLDKMYRSKITSSFNIDTGSISSLISEFQRKSERYLKTGGVHSAAIAVKKRICVFKEDIGRHNAIDKAVGHVIAKMDSFPDAILITSGRISSEVIFKMRRCNIPIIISKSAPTNQAVRHAKELDITLVGFARGNRMNIYSAGRRIFIKK